MTSGRVLMSQLTLNEQRTHAADGPVTWFGSLLNGLGGSAGGCLCVGGGLENIISAPSPGWMESFLVGGAWLEVWVWSCCPAPSLAMWKSSGPDEDERRER